MKNQFENDELLSNLSNAAVERKAPTLSDDIIYSAISTDSKVRSRMVARPKLVFTLAGGALALGMVYALPNSDGITPLSGKVDMVPFSESSPLMRAGDYKMSEEDLLSHGPKSLSDFGQTAVGNYASNEPTEYIDEVWQGQGGYNADRVWVFAVTTAVYLPNKSDSLGTMFSQENLIKFRDEIADSSDAAGIRLLIQGASNKLYPLVIPENKKPGSLYLQVLEILESDTFTRISGF
jgi:hypothetical protein